MKVHAIIEKTAAFVSKQGAQMEIILKTKQKDNPQFEFLNYENEFNPYYKHLVTVIKQGKYRPAPPQPEPDEQEDPYSYLHPSLTSSSSEIREPESAPISSQEFLESIQSKLPAGQIANTPYAKLLSNLSKHAAILAPKPVEPVETERNADSATHDVSKPPPPPPVSCPQQSSADVSPVESRNEGSPAEESRTSRKKKAKEVSECDESSSSGEKKEERDPVHGLVIIPPPPDQQPIIDKMADYVARNGPEFEMVVKMKNDERFRFLETDHIHHNYYHYKKNIFIREMEKQKAEERTEKQEQKDGSESEEKSDSEAKETNGPSKEKEETNEKTTNMNKAVCFSIKQKEEEVTSLKTRTALLYDSSDDEDEDGRGSSKSSRSGSDAASVGNKPPSRNLSRASLASSNAEKHVGNVENVERRQAEQKLADKLASVTREKLAQASRDRQLKALRKRKAAMFINMLKDASNPSVPASLTNTSVNSPATNCSATDNPLLESLDSPFNSSVPSRSMTPTLFLEQAAPVSASSTLPVSASVPVLNHMKLVPDDRPSSRSFISHKRKRSRSRSRDRSRSPKRHKHSKTPPTAYTVDRRSASKSPARLTSRSHSVSKHKSKHSRHRSTSGSRSKAEPKRNDVDQKARPPSRSHDHKSKKESESKSRKASHKKKSSKDRESSRHHKSKKHKSKSKHRKSESDSGSSGSDDERPSMRHTVSSSVKKVNPVVVDLTEGSPRAEDGGGRRHHGSSRHRRLM